MVTRQQKQTRKVLAGKHAFVSREQFPCGKLPTNKEIIERLLHEPNWYKEAAAKFVADESANIWRCVMCALFILLL